VAGGCAAIENVGHFRELVFEFATIVGQNLDDVDAVGRAGRILGEELRDIGPADVALCQPKYLFIDCLD